MAFSLIALLSLGIPVRSQSADSEDLIARASIVDKCFQRKLVEYQLQNPAIEIRYGRLTGVYVSEQIAKVTTLDLSTGTIDGPILALEPEVFCQKYLYEPFLAKFPAADQERRNRRRNGLAALGTDEIESTSIFVSSYQNLIGKHFLGHSDLTRGAIVRANLNLDEKFTPEAISLVARAAQTPDLYRWSDGRYHAHTPDYEPNEIEDRQLKIEKGKEAFVDLTSLLESEFARRAEDADAEGALIFLGILAHTFQDLIYHQGMTMRQHSGLAYALDRNPDFPKGSEAAEREEEAIKNTIWMFKKCQESISKHAWRKLTEWKPDGDFDFDRDVSQIYGLNGGSKSQDIGTISLIEYWSLALPYIQGKRSRSELVATKCEAKFGLACWDIDGIRKRVEDRFGTKGRNQ